MKYNKKLLNNALLSLGLLVLYSLAICFFDVEAIGPNGTEVGFSHINAAFASMVPYNATLDKITDVFMVIAILTALAFAVVGLVQLVKRKSLFKVDNAIIGLGVVYLVVIVLYVLFAAYCMLLIAVLFGSGLGRRYVPQDMRRPENSGLMIRLRNSNFIPLRTVYDYICGAINNTISKQVIRNNLMGNLILFAPMGVFLPAVYKSSRLKHILIMVIVLILIETVQLITGLGIFDIDDILLNFAGFFIVYWIWRSKIVEIIKKKLCIWI